MRPLPALLAGVLFLAWCGCGCRTVPVYEQRRVSKPSMEFSQSIVFQYHCDSLAQIEPGLAFSGGAQPTACSACQ